MEIQLRSDQFVVVYKGISVIHEQPSLQVLLHAREQAVVFMKIHREVSYLNILPYLYENNESRRLVVEAQPQ